MHQPLAPWWKRLVAFIIDAAIVGFSVFVIVLAIAAGAGNQNTSTNNSQATGGRVFLGILLVWIILSIPTSIYYAAMNGSRRGQTVGKMALGIAVRDARTGAPVGFWRAWGRFLITVVFQVALYIPYLLDSLAPLWDVRRQSWHDKVARTVVVDLKP